MLLIIIKTDGREMTTSLERAAYTSRVCHRHVISASATCPFPHSGTARKRAISL